MLVDVLIPSRNRPALTREAIASVAAQSYPHWRAIVVDDASEEPWPYETLASERVTVIHRPRQGGPQLARQTGFENSEAPFIAILDSDDLWAPTKLARQMEHLDVDVVLCWHDWIDMKGNLLKPVNRYTGINNRIAPMTFNNMSSPLIRREALERIGGFLPAGTPSLTTAEGVEFMIRLTASTEAYVVPEILVHCRSHDLPRTSSRSLTTSRIFADELALVEEMHRGTLINWPDSHARLLGRVAARFFYAGETVIGLRYLGAALRRSPALRWKLARQYGPTIARSLRPWRKTS